MEYWLNNIRLHGDQHVEILLLGNKIDLINDRVISEEDLSAFAEANGVSYFETSAKDSMNVDRAFK
jgi:GTPase SAR1 family protein